MAKARKARKTIRGEARQIRDHLSDNDYLGFYALKYKGKSALTAKELVDHGLAGEFPITALFGNFYKINSDEYLYVAPVEFIKLYQSFLKTIIINQDHNETFKTLFNSAQAVLIHFLSEYCFSLIENESKGLDKVFSPKSHNRANELRYAVLVELGHHVEELKGKINEIDEDHWAAEFSGESGGWRVSKMEQDTVSKLKYPYDNIFITYLKNED